MDASAATRPPYDTWQPLVTAVGLYREALRALGVMEDVILAVKHTSVNPEPIDDFASQVLRRLADTLCECHRAGFLSFPDRNAAHDAALRFYEASTALLPPPPPPPLPPSSLLDLFPLPSLVGAPSDLAAQLELVGITLQKLQYHGQPGFNWAACALWPGGVSKPRATCIHSGGAHARGMGLGCFLLQTGPRKVCRSAAFTRHTNVS